MGTLINAHSEPAPLISQLYFTRSNYLTIKEPIVKKKPIKEPKKWSNYN
jgi:hypothetical protein